MNICNCQFCVDYSTENLRERIIWEDEKYSLFPTLGCFIEGYCLYIPRHHKTSFAQLEENELNNSFSNLTTFSNCISSSFMSPVIIGEHGSGSKSCGASCIEHAHIHLIPCFKPLLMLKQYIEVGGIPVKINDFVSLRNFKDYPYLYLSIDLKNHFVWTNVEKFEKQFIRKASANIYNIGDFYNWRVYPFESKMKETYNTLIQSFNNCLNNDSKIVA
ncbi:MAG: hypothetical protein WAR79_14040 [Melioribacteraceae bacterium]